MNKHTGMGNLTRDVELRYTPSGTAYAKTGFAMNRRRRGSDGEMKEDTCFIDLTIWGKSGETFAKYFSKGDAVVIKGRLEYETWESQGQQRSKHSITVEQWHFLLSSGKDKAEKSSTDDVEF